MRLHRLAVGIVFLGLAVASPAQKIALGIAPAFDAGGDEFGDALVQHLTLFAYQDLLNSNQFTPVLLNPGGVYTPLDISWLTEYVQDRPELDLLLVPVLKPTLVDKNAATITVELSLLDAHTGVTKSTWTVSETTKEKNAWVQKGESMAMASATGRSARYGVSMPSPTSDFEKQPIGKTTEHLAQQMRDTLPAHLGGFTKTASAKAEPMGSGACAMHTKITYGYRHAASHSYTLLANGLDQTSTIADGVSTFKADEGPLLLQFTLQDGPYKLMKEPIYQLSAMHSCNYQTLVIDIGQQGDAHQHWE
ncbi:MAG TPA: hypothetical protein VN612_06310 [Acidobacteriaceae bacterium]|nr:hypothetical protein [Acidobacteriaceae bacterium]